MQTLRPEHEVVTEVIEKVAKACNTTVANIQCKSRRRYLTVIPRQLSWLFAKALTGLTFAELGYLIGGRDHSSVQHGMNSLVELVEAGDCAGVEMFRVCRHALTVGSTDRILRVQAEIDRIKKRRLKMKQREW